MPRCFKHKYTQYLCHSVLWSGWSYCDLLPWVVVLGETASNLPRKPMEPCSPEEEKMADMPNHNVHNGLNIVYIKEEEPRDDGKLYCEECGSFFFNKCEVHGPALFIPDTSVPMGVSDRAKKTLPPGLEVHQSDIPGAGLGVFNTGDTIPVGAHFGPYQGELVNKEEAMNSGYSWVIYHRGQCEEFIDATRKTHANWMRYVNCAGNDKEQNLVGFQYRGGIFYRTCRPIIPGQELLVWYAEDYVKDLSNTFNSMWNKKCSRNASKDAQVFFCTLCSHSCTTQYYLHSHIRRCHREGNETLLKLGEIKHETESPTRSPSAPQTSSGALGADKPDGIQCSECGKHFTRRKNLRTHLRIHTVNILHPCSQCGKQFKKRSHFMRHQCVHTGEKPYYCAQCGKRFTKQSHFQTHQRIHTGEKPYQCSECGKSFSQQSNLQMHQHIHTGEKPYHCSWCGKSFIRQRDLQTHQRVHTGEKPYRCSQCGKSFRHSSHFKTHQRIHTGEKPYHCSQCGKDFTVQNHLRLHERVHTGEKPYYCSQCGKRFTQQSHLLTHQRVHTGEKPYKCTQCGKSFTVKNHVVKHQRIHTGEKPYHCTECGKSFSHQKYLHRHLIIHTN